MGVARAAERIERAAIADVFTAAPTPGVVVESFDAATLTLCPDVPPLVCNRLVGFEPDASMTEDELDRAAACAATAGLPWVVSLPPHADRSLETSLRRRGFRDGYAWMKFARTTERAPAVETSLRIELAMPENAAAFADLVATYQGLPALRAHFAALPGRSGWRCFLAWADDEPVAAAASFVDGDAAWLGMAATAPSHRRWGAQSALLAARIRDAAALGATRAFVETGVRALGKPDQSYRNILRAGFEELYVRPNLVSRDFDRIG